MKQVGRVLALGWADAGVEPPRLWPGDRREIARRARDTALAVLGRDVRGPADLARALGFRVHCLPGAGTGGECTSGVHVIYRWSDDFMVRRYRVAHGVAHALLVHEQWDHSETDALLLTLDLIHF